MSRPKQSEQQVDLQETIKDTAWQQIAESGAAALSLRAIARQLRITAPAIYNYYPRRDDLVTALITDAYLSMGDAQFRSLETLPEDDHLGRLRALGIAYREWAVTFPQRYQLIFGTPIPGYHAPLEKTMPAASRSLSSLIDVLESARLAGRLFSESEPVLPSELINQLSAWQNIHPVGDVYVLYLALVIWGRVHGLTMMEISNQYPPFIKNTGDIYRREIEMLIHNYLIEE